MKPENERRKMALPLYMLLILIIGTLVRFVQLDKIPSLEHDEALICLGARDIAQKIALPLTGDKVYEGPLLEYLIAVPMALSKPDDYTARCVMAGLGVLAILLTFAAGMSIGGPVAGLSGSALMVLSVWHLAASRVIYACNLSQLFVPIWIAAFTAFLRTNSSRYLALAALAIGFAANGRFTALFLIIPTVCAVLVYSSRSRIPRFVLIILGVIIPVSPILIYNVQNEWPAISILTGPGQSHLLSDPGLLLPRLSGYLSTLFTAMDGRRFWLDVDWKPAKPVYIITGLLFLGFASSFRLKHSRKIPRIWIAGTFILLLLLVPVFTKSYCDPQQTILYHPHYLDLVMPFAILICGMAIEWISLKNFRIGAAVFTLAIFWQAHLLFHEILPDFSKNGMPGRWNGRSIEISQCIREHFDSSEARVIVPWQFGAGFPQLSFLLDEFEVEPILDRFYGVLPSVDDWKTKSVVLAFPIQNIRSPPWKRLECKFGNRRSGINIFQLQSPGFLLDGKWLGADHSEIRISSTSSTSGKDRWPEIIATSLNRSFRLHVESRNDVIGMHPLFNPDDIRVSTRHRRTMQMINQTVVAHQVIALDDNQEEWEFFWQNDSLSGEPRLIRIRRGFSIIDGTWSGICIFY